MREIHFVSSWFKIPENTANKQNDIEIKSALHFDFFVHICVRSTTYIPSSGRHAYYVPDRRAYIYATLRRASHVHESIECCACAQA